MIDFVREKVASVEFGMLSPEIIKKMGVVRIVTPELYDADGFPVEGGLMDSRMGIIDPGLPCKTCGSKVKECPGHFGYIELARPVIHIQYAPLIYRVLRGTCKECSRVLLDEAKIEEYKGLLKQYEQGVMLSPKLFKNIEESIKSTGKCPHCGAKQKKVKFIKPMTFIEEGKKLTSIDIRSRLERVPDSDIIFFGFMPGISRPEWALLTLLPVSPTTVRPSITLENGQRSEDDLTHKLGDIMRTNQRLFENLNAGAPEVIIEDLWELLQYHITTLFNNNVSQVPPARHRSGRPLKTLADRIKSKEGRFRRNLAGKRVNYCARTVVSPDAYLSVDEVGVPQVIASQVTYPEKVTSWNIKWLKELIKRGPNEYPGANYVITLDDKKKRITEETKKAILDELVEGYVVERHMIDGDRIIFNRQPSLHRMSMMSHTVRVLPGRTFRLNLCTTVPYNADFDGDEMNLHFPQTPEAQAEAEILMNVKHHLITPRYGLPIIGCKHAHISGNYILTGDETVFTRKDAMQLLYGIGIEKEFEKEKITGKEIFSVLLPPDFDYEGKTNACKKCDTCKKEECPYNAYIIVRNGQLKKGRIDAKSIGSEKGRLLHKLIIEYGADVSKEFLDKASLLGIRVLREKGMTVAISDTDVPVKVRKKIDEVLDLSEKRVKALIEKFEEKKMEALPGRTTEETLELRVINILNRARNQCGEIVSENALPSGTMTMAMSGARGSLLNLALIAACVGQQDLRGERINKGYDRRTLPHFKKDDFSGEPHGFIKHGYKQGLTPFEFFFHSMTGRDSLMDTSMRTPKSGYLQRRLINALQDLKVTSDLSVRNGDNEVIQFAYGEDGVDVSRSDHGKVSLFIGGY